MKKFKFGKLLRFAACIVLIVIGIKVTDLTNNKSFLNLFAQSFFDEQYYLATYPEVKNQPLSPFEHFSNIGWKEGKNPNSELDSYFSRNFNLNNNKHNLSPLRHYVKAKLLLQKLL